METKLYKTLKTKTIEQNKGVDVNIKGRQKAIELLEKQLFTKTNELRTTIKRKQVKSYSNNTFTRKLMMKMVKRMTKILSSIA